MSSDSLSAGDPIQDPVEDMITPDVPVFRKSAGSAWTYGVGSLLCHVPPTPIMMVPYRLLTLLKSDVQLLNWPRLIRSCGRRAPIFKRPSRRGPLRLDDPEVQPPCYVPDRWPSDIPAATTLKYLFSLY